ncbi:hypothetical protein IAE22_30335, partial [Bacillus sp. S34]|nr:hypothetical protein [Bacillus sp. S34]
MQTDRSEGPDHHVGDVDLTTWRTRAGRTGADRWSALGDRWGALPLLVLTESSATATSLNYATDHAYGGSSGFQVGSTYKMFTLLAWLAAGKSPDAVVNGTRHAQSTWTQLVEQGLPVDEVAPGCAVADT